MAVRRPVTPSPGSPDDPASILAAIGRLTEEVAALRESVERRLHQLEVTVRCKVEAPADSLPLAQAAKVLGCCQKTLKRRAGIPRQFFADDLAEYRPGGAAGVARLRREHGRD